MKEAWIRLLNMNQRVFLVYYQLIGCILVQHLLIGCILIEYTCFGFVGFDLEQVDMERHWAVGSKNDVAVGTTKIWLLKTSICL